MQRLFVLVFSLASDFCALMTSGISFFFFFYAFFICASLCFLAYRVMTVMLHCLTSFLILDHRQMPRHSAAEFQAIKTASHPCPVAVNQLYTIILYVSIVRHNRDEVLVQSAVYIYHKN